MSYTTNQKDDILENYNQLSHQISELEKLIKPYKKQIKIFNFI